MDKLKISIRDREGDAVTISFTEAGEVETAKEILREDSAFEQPNEFRQKINLTFDEIDNLISEAITLSAAGNHEKAKEVMLEANIKLESVKNIYQSISDSQTNIPKKISTEDKSPDTSRPQREYFYNYYKHQKNLLRKCQ